MQLQMIMWFSIVTVVSTLGIYYIGKRLIKPMKWNSLQKRIAWIILVTIFILPIISMSLVRIGDGANFYLAWVTYVGLGFASFVFILLFFRDTSLLLMRGTRKLGSFFTPKISVLDASRREFLVQTSNIGIIAAAGAATSYGIYEARKVPGIVNVEVPIARLPKEFDGFSIAQISDIHAGLTVKRDWIETVTEKIQSLNPDLIAFTGDMADGSVRELENDVAPLKDLHAPFGKYFVTGNHEYYSGAEQWIRHAGKLGYDVLMNEHRTLEKNGAKIILAGVTDYSAGQFDKEQTSNPEKAIQSASNGDTKILMAHQPRTLYKTDNLDFDIVLNGHTHGGQFFPWNLLATVGQPFIKGLHRYNNSWVYVSKGTGYWGPPVRVGARSEITLLTLRATT
jgi:hypothetical protein